MFPVRHQLGSNTYPNTYLVAGDHANEFPGWRNDITSPTCEQTSQASPTAKRRPRASAARTTDSAFDKSASLAGATHEALRARHLKEKGQTPPKEETPRPSTAEESPAEGRSPSVEASLAGSRALKLRGSLRK